MLRAVNGLAPVAVSDGRLEAALLLTPRWEEMSIDRVACWLDVLNSETRDLALEYRNYKSSSPGW